MYEEICTRELEVIKMGEGIGGVPDIGEKRLDKSRQVGIKI